MNERSQIDLNGFLYILMLPLTTTVLCNHDKITLRAETQMRMMKHKGDESVKLLQKKKERKKEKSRKLPFSSCSMGNSFSCYISQFNLRYPDTASRILNKRLLCVLECL